ncbi:MAG: PAS domain S-box protein [Gemmatimonas sp.]|nr:PAS domain S-box protein [Gemmatimonas sp.]
MASPRTSPRVHSNHCLWRRGSCSRSALYEELLFRVLLVGGFFGVFRTSGLPVGQAGTFSVILASLVFSAFHYIGPYGDSWALPSFLFSASCRTRVQCTLPRPRVRYRGLDACAVRRPLRAQHRCSLVGPGHLCGFATAIRYPGYPDDLRRISPSGDPDAGGDAVARRPAGRERRGAGAPQLRTELLSRQVDGLLAARRKQVLRISQATFEGILSVAADGVISVSEAQRITFFNRGAEAIFGYTAADVIGKPLEILIPEEARSAHTLHVRRFAASEVDSRWMGKRGDVTGRRQNGELFPAEASISKIEVGGATIFTTILRDLTDRLTFREAKAGQRTIQAVGTSPRGGRAAGLSHEARRPGAPSEDARRRATPQTALRRPAR